MIVHKYGGTSLRNLNKDSKVLQNIRKCTLEGNQVLVVVSAIGRKGEPYATDSLIELLERISRPIDPKKKDLIMACGEIISCVALGHLLDSVGIPSQALTGYQGGIITDSNFNHAKIIYIDTANIRKYLDDNKVVIVAGFQGANRDGEITTLGRGGSDTSAVALAGYLGADRVDIFTDVPGVAPKDPRLFSDVDFFDYISYEEMYKLAINGAKVIHPEAVLMGEKFNMPIRITSTESDSKGTLIGC